MGARALRHAAIAAAAAALAVPALAGAEPVVVAEQTGLVRQVVRAQGVTAWTRCASPSGPTDVFAVRGRTRPARIVSLRARGACEPQRLLGISRGALVVLAPATTGGGKRLVEVALPAQTTRVIAEATPGPEGTEIVDAALGGRRVAWIRETGPARRRVQEILVADLADPTSPPAVVHTRVVGGGAVTLTGVWVSPRGSVAFRERLQGALYGYGNGQDRLRLRESTGRIRDLATTSGVVRVAGASLSGRFLAYSVVREGDRRVWIYAFDLDRNIKKRLRLLRAAPPRLAPDPPAVPVPYLSGSQAVWRERSPKGRRFVDAIRSSRAVQTERRPVESLLDVPGQKLFQSPPTVTGGVAAWSIVRFTRPAGVSGGWAGLSKVRARSTIVYERIPPRR